MQLLIATSNHGKLREFSQIIKTKQIQLQGLNYALAVPETGKTFTANAILKVKAYGVKSNLLTVADDSGLVIDFLHGYPGIHTSRFANNNYYQAMNQLLLQLQNVPIAKRTARFICCLALYNPTNKLIKTFSGEVPGTIAFKFRGRLGLGFDPIFLPAGFKKTFGQMAPAQKNLISHRARACQKLTQYLSQLPASQS